jgi:MoxR-like ATPase
LEAKVNVTLLFRKRTPLHSDGLPWLRGAEEHTFVASRNPAAYALVSAILVRALLAAADGRVIAAAGRAGSDLVVEVRSSSAPGGLYRLAWNTEAVLIPHGGPGQLTYHLGLLGLGDALASPHEAGDLLHAYAAFLAAYRSHGRSPEIRAALLRAGDELFHWLRFREAAPDPAHDRLQHQVVGDLLQVGAPPWTSDPLPVEALVDQRLLEKLAAGVPLPASPPAPAAPAAVPPPASEEGSFVGPQLALLNQALAAGETVLLAGPTGSGKTLALQQAALELGINLVVVEGKEGLVDLDFLGAILPQELAGGPAIRRWVDGPLLRAMRQAQRGRTLLFLDELNRIPRHHLNLLLGLMNPKTGELCRLQGLEVSGDGPYYVIEVPLTAEVVACPTAQLLIVAAGNFGRAYAVYDLDPAVRRRFSTVIEFEYLPFSAEMELVVNVTDLEQPLAETLVRLAHETRRLAENGELPGCVDTASLLNWAGKCARSSAATLSGVMEQARLAWADQVCGRDHTGRVTPGNFQALEDYLGSLGSLPSGEAQS